MIFENIFSYIYFFCYLLLFVSIYFYIKKIVKNRGFNNLCMFILTFALFYLVVPFIQTFFKEYRNTSSLFSIILNTFNETQLFFNLLICVLCLVIILTSYKLTIRSVKTHQKYKHFKLGNENNILVYKKVKIISDIIFFASITCIVLLIIEVGSISTYLALGSLTRGLDKMPTHYIRSSYLQLITFSTLILIPPYLYLYLYRIKKEKLVKIRLIISLIFASLFLLYNQGRAPLILFFLPIMMSINNKKKNNFIVLIILGVVGLISLKYLDALFTYFSYGYFEITESENYITSFLGEFSYPFTNFMLRDELVKYSEYRYLYDYVIWPFTMIPSSILKLIGISKEGITSISSINTEIYGFLLNVSPKGGIPVDFLTVNFYQLGYISLILSCVFTGRVLKVLDKISFAFNDNFPIKILVYRISFSMINILNNADMSAVVRNRLDVAVLVVILIYIYIAMINKNKYINEVRDEKNL